MTERTIDPSDAAIDVQDWQRPERIAWSFQHMDELFDCDVVAATPDGAADFQRAPIDMSAIDVDGQSVSEVLDTTDTDALVVLHGDKIVIEEYRGDMSRTGRHLLMSVSKSVTSSIAGALIDRGDIDPQAPLATYVPELAASGYAEATTRQLMDMRSGIRFSEAYLDPESDVRQIDAAVGWGPRTGAHWPRTLHELLARLGTARAHGGVFEYRSCETDMLGWICEAASGHGFASLASEMLWQPLGALHDATLCIDGAGAAMTDAGLSTTAADLLRFGAMVRDHGVAQSGRQVLPEAWTTDIVLGASDSAAAFAAGPSQHGFAGGSYRSNFWIPVAGGSVAMGIGIHGQALYIDWAANLVAVKFSHWARPVDPAKAQRTGALFAAITAHTTAAG